MGGKEFLEYKYYLDISQTDIQVKIEAFFKGKKRFTTRVCKKDIIVLDGPAHESAKLQEEYDHLLNGDADDGFTSTDDVQLSPPPHPGLLRRGSYFPWSSLEGDPQPVPEIELRDSTINWSGPTSTDSNNGGENEEEDDEEEEEETEEVEEDDDDEDYVDNHVYSLKIKKRPQSCCLRSAGMKQQVESFSQETSTQMANFAQQLCDIASSALDANAKAFTVVDSIRTRSSTRESLTRKRQLDDSRTPLQERPRPSYTPQPQRITPSPSPDQTIDELEIHTIMVGISYILQLMYLD